MVDLNLNGMLRALLIDGVWDELPHRPASR